MFKGRATPEATKAFLERHQIHPDQRRKFCGVNVSSVAIGTYLGPMDEGTDQRVTKAVLQAIENGVNFIDTSINYRGQRAERSIGEAFRRGTLAQKFKREEIFVSTKAGFVPYEGNHVQNLAALFDEQYVQKGVAKKSDLVAQCHCLAPDFLNDQIERSRKNLQLETIDLYYLHNPEMQLEELPARIFYEKLELAFETLEKAVLDGKIANYGMATWDAFRDEETVQTYVSLEKCTVMAEKAAEKLGIKQHHFKAVQMPLSLAMPEAALLAGQKVNKSITEVKKLPAINAAKELGLDVATSAPLMQSRLCHDLPDFILENYPKDFSQAHCALAFPASFPAVDAVMVGMKDPLHVEHDAQFLKRRKLTIVELEKVIEGMMER